MIHALIEIGLGYVLWKIVPGKITAGSKKVRTYIDLALQIIGILLMITGVINIIKHFTSLL